MGGEGSIQSMIISLRNNKNLLRGRGKGFFRRELTYSKLREYYRDSKDPIEQDNVDEQKLRAIRRRIKKDRQIEFFQIAFVLLLLGSILVLLANWSYHSLFDIKQQPTKNELIKKRTKSDDYRLKSDSYLDRLEQGKNNMKRKQYFLAVGNFENALRKKPNDPTIELKVAESLCLLCHERYLECEKAEYYINKMLEKYPNDRLYKRLRKEFLE